MRFMMFSFVTVAIVFSLSTEVFARTFVIPSPLVTARDVHGTGAAAAWSTRNRLNASWDVISGEDKFDGDVTEESDQNTFEFNIFKRLNEQIILEAQYELDQLEQNEKSPDNKIETDTGNFLIRAGLLANENLVFGLDIGQESETEEDESFGKTDSDTDSLLFSLGFRRDTQYFMVGVENEDYESSGFSDESNTLLLGYGKSDDECQWELLFGYQNESGVKIYDVFSQMFWMTGTNQHAVSLQYFRVTNDNSTKAYLATYAYDIDMGSFYFRPTGAIRYFDDKVSNTTEPLVNLELGKRLEQFTYYGAVGYSMSETEIDAISSEAKETELTLTAGINWNF